METALVTLSEFKLRARRDEEGQFGLLLGKWLDEPNDVLATLLIGNNLVNIAASALATHLTELLLLGSDWAGWGIPIAVGVMTLLILVVGEVAPKTYAKHHPERYIKALPLLRPFYWFTYPFMKVLVATTGSLVRAMGGDVDADRMRVTEEDIEEMVRVGGAEGSIGPEATRLLTGVLELDEKVAREIMVPRSEINAIAIDAPLDEILGKVAGAGYSRYPVYRDKIDNIEGVLYAKDLFAAVTARGKDAVQISQIMRQPMIYPENISVEDLLVAMKRQRVHLAILASEYGGVAGVVSLEDIVEEVFGDIYDEHDRRREAMHAVGEASWLVEGVVTLSDLEDRLGGLKLVNDDEDYETVAGLLMKAAGRVPEPGFTYEAEGVHFEVMRADATRLLEVAVEDRRQLPELQGAAS